MSVLQAFSPEADTLSLAQLAVRTGFYKSTILRLAASLQHCGFLIRLDDGRFRLGPEVFQLGRIYQGAFRLADVVVPALRALVKASGETASFYVRDGDRETCLHRIEPARPVRDAGVAEGDSFVIDGSACSRVLSAFLGKRGKAFDVIRRQVMMVARPSMRVVGVAAIVCPVFGSGERLSGAILLSGPEARYTDAAVAKMRRLMLAHACGLTRALGGDVAIYSSVRV